MRLSTEITRRLFLGSLGAGSAGLRRAQALSCGEVGGTAATSSERHKADALDLSRLPNFCSHEHWGSIDSVGMASEGFRADVERGAIPKTKTTLFDILLDPYFKGMLAASGADPDALARQAGVRDFRALATESPVKAFGLLETCLIPQRLTGTYQCIRRGLLDLYGIDTSGADADAISRLDIAIARNYERIFDWYWATMRKVFFTELIRPVHPEFYAREDSPAAATLESSFTHTVMRVDPLLALWTRKSTRRDSLARITGIDPRDAMSWRSFIAKLFDLAAQKRACGIKQLQAYSRSLDYIPRQDREVVWAGDLQPERVRIFQDWVMHECCKQAQERGWAHQVHVGTHNLAQSSPLPLALLAERYPRMKIVMIHCWPFLAEAGWLAKYHPNMYIDTCWQPVLNPAFFREAISGWLNYVPTHKITCSHDATSIEMAMGSSLFTREILGEVLTEQLHDLGVPERDLKRVALDMLHNNMVAIYGIGKTVSVDQMENWSSGYYTARAAARAQSSLSS